MTAVFRAVLPLPTSVNASLKPVRLRNGALRQVHTQDARNWASTAVLRLLAMRRPRELHTGPVELSLRVHVPTIASDGGNRLKLLEDALVKARVLDDDRQIAEWSIVKVVGEGEPRVEVEVTQADPAKHPELARRLAEAERKRTRQTGARR